MAEPGKTIDRFGPQKALCFLYEAGFQTDGHAVHFAGNLVIAVHQADGFRFRATLEHLRASAQFQILDQDDTITIGQHIAVGIFDDPRTGGSFGLASALPFVAARDAL
jgi:hypothetical protein